MPCRHQHVAFTLELLDLTGLRELVSNLYSPTLGAPAKDRLSFPKALGLICDAIPEFQIVAPEQHEALYRRLLADIAHHRLPEREGRINPRVVKRKMSNFRLKRAEHRHWPQPSVPFREAVAISHRNTVPALPPALRSSIARWEAVPVLK